ncbi:methionine adenosyltransferase [Streptomyces sp. NPDC059378]|uniref:methionine adenosyltransferase n=1 Tax=Streptomyces sp. NPDC059378 TaxID=3346815 RepID=UPI0036AB3EC2
MRHPDTLADGVAEAISHAYSRYCLEEFGAILHRNTDKPACSEGPPTHRISAGPDHGPGRVRNPCDL